MEMVNNLATVPAGVDNHFVSTLVNPLLLGNEFCPIQQSAEQGAVVLRRCLQRINMPFRNDENMDRRFWIDVAECKQLAVFEDDVAWFSPACNAAEETIRHGSRDKVRSTKYENV